MLHLSTILKHYKRKEVQDAILQNSYSREVAIKYSDKGFGKRPDVLSYAQDILELAKHGATSFHISEERWENPKNLDTSLKKQELEDLRTGWDLVLDVDFEVWEATKLITDAIYKALLENGIKSVSCKFSGNKGFHLAVPFESFPSKVSGMLIKGLFPDGVKKIAAYIMDYIDNKNNKYVLSKKIVKLKNFQEYLKTSGKELTDFVHTACESCGNKIAKKISSQIKFICSHCGYAMSTEKNEKFSLCPKCSKIMEKFVQENSQKCSCGSSSFVDKVDLAIDTMLISSRHLYRSVYSLHEKSGLVSVPIDPAKILQFEKESAKPANIKFEHKFLDSSKSKPNEAAKLVVHALDFKLKTVEDEKIKKTYEDYDDGNTEALPVELFPPCIKLGLNGLEDGKKRFMFILNNFLKSVNWSNDKIGEVMKEWNKRNKEQLRETNIVGHLRYNKTKKAVLPPNCENTAYYKDLLLCAPDNLCPRIKNPVNYSKIKAKMLRKKPKSRTRAKDSST